MISQILRLTLLASCTLALLAKPVQANDQTLRLYIDADRTHNQAAGLSIERGVQTALSEIDFQIQGYQIEIVTKDHRANSLRSKLHLDQFLADPQALAVYGGLHSPPLIKNRNFINENEILTLVPWAAAGPITRSQTEENWIYRLSVDDSKAGHVMFDFAVQQAGCQKPHLLLEDTPWGNSNNRTMSQAAKKHNISLSGVSWFGWNIEDHSARTLLRDISSTGADCILFVANAPEGITFAHAMTNLPAEQRMKIISHWGITGGNFHTEVPAKQRSKLSLHFIQSCFSFVSSPETDFSHQVLQQAQAYFPESTGNLHQMEAPVGFIHAYDVTKLLIAAINQTQLGSDMAENRRNIKAALENLNVPVQGLVKNYNKPFSAYSHASFDAHEALDPADFCMASYGNQNEIIVLNQLATQ